MKQVTTLGLVSLVGIFVLLSASNVLAANYYCYKEIGGDTKFYVRMPITQPNKSDNAAEALGNGFIALAAMIKRNVSYVVDGGTRYTTKEYVEKMGGQPQDRLVIQFLPASGFHAGTLPAGSVQMGNSTIVDRAEDYDEVQEGQANDSEPLEVFPVVAIKGIGKKSIKGKSDAQEFYRYESNNYFDDKGKLKDSVFEEKKSDMCVIYIERNINITSFLRFQGSGPWGFNDGHLAEAEFGQGFVYASCSDLSVGEIYAIDFDCLSERQAEYVRKGMFGRALQTTTETLGNWLNKGKEKLKDMNLLGQ